MAIVSHQCFPAMLEALPVKVPPSSRRRRRLIAAFAANNKHCDHVYSETATYAVLAPGTDSASCSR